MRHRYSRPQWHASTTMTYGSSERSRQTHAPETTKVTVSSLSPANDYRDNALAIVGLSFRLPSGIATLGELWSALSSGRNLITDSPAERFDQTRFLDPNVRRPGKSYTFAGGYIDEVAAFDADYFGISPREAASMDPQHRLLLEMTAEALDDGGIDPATIAGSDTSVFVGMSDIAYMHLQMTSPDTITAHTVSGGTLSRASNRISHTFDLRGPSMTIDTACSSMMVALHQACQAILKGESAIAVVGGMHLLLSPYGFVGFSKATMLSPSGRCATFSASADGYVRAEGGGVIVVKRLAAALRAGDRVHAIILATHANTDGRTSSMAVPSVHAQEALLREAYARAGVGPDDIAYFEAHGTGTPVGDPIECQAIGNALGRRRSPGHPLPIGSVKTNLGHMEPASGIPGILKAILILRHRIIPPSLHGTPPNPLIDFAALGLAPVHENQPVADGAYVVGVNSFGFGGANAHAVLAAPADTLPQPTPEHGELPVTVSARTPAALRHAADFMSRHLSRSPDDHFYHACYTASRRRGGHRHRAVVLASSPAAAAEALASIAQGEDIPTGVAVGVAAAHKTPAFVFSGNGSQWAAMGADLLTAEPTFKTAIDEVDAILAPRLGWSVLAELSEPVGRSRIHDTAFAQPTLFALQVGLVQLLAAQKIRPGAVMGHSVGEVAAAWCAGALSLSDACTVIAARSSAQATTAGYGRMGAVGISQSRAEQALTAFAGRLELAAVNSDRDVTVSGDRDALAEFASLLEPSVFFRELDLDYAFHSRIMDPLRPTLRAALTGIEPKSSTIAFVSSVTGACLTGTELDADYWWRNIRDPVLFAQGAEWLLYQDYDVIVEIGPHPVLAGYLRHTCSANRTAAIVATLRRDRDGPGALRTTTAALMAAGAHIDHNRYFPKPGRVVDLPAYPWQRECHWHGTAGQWVRSSGDGTIDHPMLGERIPLLEPTWLATIEPSQLPWLAGHRIMGSVVMPAVGYIEMAIAAGRRIHHAPVEIHDLAIPAALPLTWDATMDVRIQTSVSSDDGAIHIASSTTTSSEWRVHARGRIRRQLCDPPPPIDLPTLAAAATERLETPHFYRLLAEAGGSYGADFQVLHDIHRGADYVVARYRSDIDQSGYEAHPVILDSALHAGILLLNGQTFLPGAIDHVRLWRRPAPHGFVHIRQRSRSSREVCWDVTVGDDDGDVVAQFQGCRMRRVGGEKLPPARFVTVMRAAAQPEQPGTPSPLPSPPELAAAAQERIDDLNAAWNQGAYEHFAQTVKEGAAHYAAAAILAMLAGQTEFTTDDILAAGMLPKYRPVWHLFRTLGERFGLLERCGTDRWRLTGKQLCAHIEDVFDTYPSYAAECLLYLRLIQHLPDILCGRLDPIDLLFGDSGTANLEHFYDTGPLLHWHNRVALSLIEPAVAAWPADRNLKVLEVGAGTGGMTAAVLPIFPPERTEYVFTDISPAFFPSAQTRFHQFGFVTYRRLDIDNDPQTQGFTDASFDLIIASNALHVSRDLRQSLTHLGQLLIPNGHLLTLESHDPEMLIVFALLDQFWSFTDRDLRTQSPLLTRDQWPALLHQCGYSDVVQVGVDREPTAKRLFSHPGPPPTPHHHTGAATRRTGRIVGHRHRKPRRPQHRPSTRLGAWGRRRTPSNHRRRRGSPLGRTDRSRPVGRVPSGRPSQRPPDHLRRAPSRPPISGDASLRPNVRRFPPAARDRLLVSDPTQRGAPRT